MLKRRDLLIASAVTTVALAVPAIVEAAVPEPTDFDSTARKMFGADAVYVDYLDLYADWEVKHEFPTLGTDAFWTVGRTKHELIAGALRKIINENSDKQVVLKISKYLLVAGELHAVVGVQIRYVATNIVVFDPATDKITSVRKARNYPSLIEGWHV